MRIFDIFSIRKDFNYLKNSGKFDELKSFIESEIINYVKQELAGSDKKAAVVAAVLAFIAKTVTPINGVIGAILTALAPALVQYIYESLQKYVDGLTVQA